MQGMHNGWERFWRDRWFILEVGTIAIYFGGFALRCSHPTFTPHLITAKSLLATSSFLLVIRLARFYEFFTELGPKV